MRKKLTAVIACAAMIVTFATGEALAQTENLNAKENIFTEQSSFDTLSYTQDDYSIMNSSVSRKSDDSSQVEFLIKGFLASTKASIREPKLYDNKTSFISNAAIDNDTIEYRLTEAQYQNALNNAMGWSITEDNISFSKFNVEFDGESAVASIVEDYTYFATYGFDSESFRRREYTFQLKKEETGWKIVNITTNDPWELQEDFVYVPIDVQGKIEAIVNEKNSVDEDTSIALEDAYQKEDSQVEATATSLSRWTYSTKKAVEYAVAHYADTENSVFGFTSGNDCQNFASQCVWAGLGGSGSSTSARPAVSKSVAGAAAPNVWQRDVATSCYDEYKYNWTWDNVNGFANMMKVSTTLKEGPFGNTQYSGYFANTDVGNVLIIDWGEAPAKGTLDHAMFVTGVEGTAGSRTTSQVKIAAHTSPTNSAYQVLSKYCSSPASAYARIIVDSGYYSTAQPK